MKLSHHIRDLANTDAIRKAISYAEMARDGASFIHARKDLYDREQSLLQDAVQVEQMEKAGEYMVQWLVNLAEHYPDRVVAEMPVEGFGVHDLTEIFGGLQENEPREQRGRQHYSSVRISTSS